MKKILFVLAVLVTAMTCHAQKAVEKYKLNLGEFSELHVIDGINVEVRHSADSVGIIEFETTSDIAPKILAENRKGVLKLQLQTDGVPIPRIPKVTVYSNLISQVENSGDSTVTVISPAPAAKMKFRIIGNGLIIARDIRATVVEGKIDSGRGTLVLNGQSNTVKLRNVGSGSVQAGDLSATTASIVIAGTGSVDCQVADELTITGLGSGRVYCKGSPKVKNRTLGSVKVEYLE